MREPTEESFLKDVSNHQIKFLKDEYLYRHIRFRRQESGNMWFDLVTWPNVLTIHGDMGTWTFSRVEDMLTFFRDSKLRINPSYWAEKLQHGQFSGREGAKVWDQDTFQERLLDQLKDRFEDEPEKLAEVKAAVEEEVFRLHDGDGPHMMRHAAYEFTHEFETKPGTRNGEKFQFDGMELPDGMVYSYHFIWCLYAIVWGIQQYDAMRSAPVEGMTLINSR
jgi:hypothetical protein